MNSFASRFSRTEADIEVRNARRLEDDSADISDAMWGSQAGFGNLVNGTHSFDVPSVADVSCSPASA